MVKDEEYRKLYEAFEELYSFVKDLNKYQYEIMFEEIRLELVKRHTPTISNGVEYLPTEPLNIEIRDVNTNELVTQDSVTYNKDKILIKVKKFNCYATYFDEAQLGVNEETDSPYCKVCGACGEADCCPPEKCNECLYGDTYKKDYNSLVRENDKMREVLSESLAKEIVRVTDKKKKPDKRLITHILDALDWEN